MEVVHTRDVGLAVANAVLCDEALGRTLLIAGGESCRIRASEMRAGISGVLGMPTFPESAFNPQPFYTDFMDTEEAERLLHFQRYDFEDYLDDIRPLVPRLYPIFLRPFGGLLMRQLLKRSPHYHAPRSEG